MFRRSVHFVLFAIITVSFPFTSQAEIQTNASHAIIMDSETQEVLFSHNSQARMVPSSMTKIMTLYMLFERLNAGVFTLEDTLHVSEKAWRMGGSKMFVRVDTNVVIEDLIRGIVVQSGNDACVVVAEAIAGSEEAFAERMNEKAKELGMLNTHFVNATGWPDDNHYTTAYDLSLLSARLIKDFPQYYHYFNEKSYTYNNIRQSNRNLLLWRASSNVDGLKTGHTEAGGYGIVVSGREDGRRMIVVVNGMESTKLRADEAERLLSYGFRYFETVTLANVGQVVGSADVWQGVSEQVELKVKDKIELTLPKLGQEKTKISLHYNTPLIAPIQADQQVGEIHVIAPGQEMVKKVPLYTASAIERKGIFGRFVDGLVGN